MEQLLVSSRPGSGTRNDHGSAPYWGTDRRSIRRQSCGARLGLKRTPCQPEEPRDQARIAR